MPFGSPHRAGAFAVLAAAVSTSCLLPLTAATRVGMMYEAWHAPSFFGRGSAGLTVEAVLQSNGSLTVADMQAGMNTSLGMSFYWHKQPAAGFYCIFRNRPNGTSSPSDDHANTNNINISNITNSANSSNGIDLADKSKITTVKERATHEGLRPRVQQSHADPALPDCPNITATLTRHAAMLTDAGVDFVFADSTNIQNAGYAADVLQLRPIEVLLEEWAALRAAGVPTPRVVVWQNLQDAAGDLWKSVVALYQDQRYADLLYRDDAPGGTGKQVMFTTSSPAQALVDAIEASGEVVVVTAWALHHNYQSGELSFFSPCTDAVSRACRDVVVNGDARARDQ
jgi:hypothetical protein